MYEEYISLGFDCKVASSMSKYGLRSFSGPFDWYVSDFSSVLKCMEEDFRYFLLKENLVEIQDKPHFVDKRYGFYFIHDIETSLDKDYDIIKEKYLRRISKFCNSVKRKTCFIRAIRTEDELSYIKENQDYIKKIIKSTNIENQIIYIIIKSEFSNVDLMEFPYFVTDSLYFTPTREDLRALFDSSPRIVNYLLDNYSGDKRNRNIIVDLQKHIKELEVFSFRYNLMIKMECAVIEKMDIPECVMIYGVGNIGRILYDKVKMRCRVICFIDNYNNERTYKNIPIIKLHELKGYDCRNIRIIITPTYEYDKIQQSLYKACGNQLNVQSLDAFLDTSKIKE
jgi:hypothetical protein